MENWVDPSRVAIVLPRVSTLEQVGNYSWKDQLDLAELARQDGFFNVEIMEEAGVSGEDLDKRPVLQRVLERIRTGSVGALYLMNWSRGSRDEDLIDGRLIVQACRKFRCFIRLPEGVYNFENEDDENVADIGFLIAKWHKRAMVKNTARGQYRKAREGKFIGGRLQFGYRFRYTLVDTPRGPRMMADYEKDPDEIQIASYIHNHFPKLSTRRWAAVMNRLARWGRVPYFPVKSHKDQERTGKKVREWEQHDIINIIENDMLIGRLSWCAYDSKPYQRGVREKSRFLRGVTPVYVYREDLRAIDDETFERNNRLLRERGRTAPRTVGSPYAYSGVLRCPRCLRPLNSHGSKSDSYICTTYQKSGSAVCRGFIVHELGANDVILPLVTEILTKNIGPSVAAARQNQNKDAQIARVKSDLERIERELENLMTYARQGAIAATQLKQQNQRLLAEQQEKQSELNKLTKSNAEKTNLSVFTEEFIANLPEFLKFLYAKKKRLFNQVVRLIFAGVVLNSERTGRHWKKGLKLPYGQRTPRPYFLQWFEFDPRFKEWAEKFNLILPTSMQAIYNQGCTTTGVPIGAQS
jgi:site-specific DNA recombinase